MKKNISKIVAGLLLASPAFAIDLDQFEIYGYGNIYYSNYEYLSSYQKPAEERSKVDLERFVLSPRFIIDENIKIVSEIEFEHGGTGATMEYDTLDEFGEFETEVEKGGEIIVEEIYVDFSYKEWMNFKVGHMIIPVGLNSQRHLPTLYLSTSRNISETTILPNTWHETGVMAYGDLGASFSYQAMIMNGLNSEGFDSKNWIRSGHQKRFEYANADNLAFAFRLDYGNILDANIGFSYYIGNSNDNRHKEQLESKGTVSIYDIHAVYDRHNIRFRALALLGTLSNSKEITEANRNLPNALEVKRTPVASESLAYFVELGYNISSFFDYSREIIPFVKYDYVNSMYKTESGVQSLDRYENKITTLGIDYFIRENIVFKADYATTKFGEKAKIEDLHNFTLALGFTF